MIHILLRQLFTQRTVSHVHLSGKTTLQVPQTMSTRHANISCACSHSPNGIAPYSHLGDGNMHLVLVRHGSFFNNLRLLLNLSNKKKHIEELPFVETYSAKEFCFRSLGSTSRWNCDGEIQHQSNIRAKVSRQLLTIFSRGRPEVAETMTKCCGM